MKNVVNVLLAMLLMAVCVQFSFAEGEGSIKMGTPVTAKIASPKPVPFKAHAYSGMAHRLTLVVQNPVKTAVSVRIHDKNRALVHYDRIRTDTAIKHYQINHLEPGAYTMEVKSETGEKVSFPFTKE